MTHALRVFAFTLILPLYCIPAHSQTSSADYSKNPVWIQMLDDTNANYYEVITAYEAFWANHQIPQMERDIMNKFDREHPEIEEEHSFLYKIFHSKELKDEEEMKQYVFAVKKYEHWKQVNFPYVQSDGRILTPHERIEIWKEQRK